MEKQRGKARLGSLRIEKEFSGNRRDLGKDRKLITGQRGAEGILRKTKERERDTSAPTKELRKDGEKGRLTQPLSLLKN